MKNDNIKIQQDYSIPDELNTETEKISSESPDELFARLVRAIKSYHPSADLGQVKAAYELAKSAHGEQKRKSGEPYIIHPLNVAIILASLELDKESIIASLLHDVVEDTDYTLDDVAEKFGEEIAALVDGVTKLGQLNYKADQIEIQAENLRKMFLAMAKDIRVVLIKLADRLHNMRTLKYMREEKQKEKARETLDIYAPIAQRLGISKIKVELDDLSLKYLNPDVYYDLVDKIVMKKSVRENYVKEIVKEVQQHIQDAGINAKVEGRVKHFFSIYKKMVNQNKTIDQIYDLFAVRIIVDSVKDSYAALGVIHEFYTPIPGRMKDYIAMPKPNMYQSLHTTLIGADGQPFEIQIRTEEMHKTAEYGIAAHWKYKEASDGKSVEHREEEKLTWLRQILEWQRDMSDNQEFMSLLKDDLNLFSEAVYCFTPNGEVKNLKAGATPIDFAYSIHTAVGNKMIGARVNGKLVPIDYKIQNGDRIEVLTSQNSKGPSRDWLSIVRTTQAKNKINQWFKNQLKDENINKGREMLATYCKMKAIKLADINKPEYKSGVMKKYGFKDWESVLAAIGHGGLKEGQVANKLVDEYLKANPKAITDSDLLAHVNMVHENTLKNNAKKDGIVVKGVEDVSVRFSRCCTPVPGDSIVGFITRGRGVSIHRTDCINVVNMPEVDRVRLIEAEWGNTENIGNTRYMTDISVYGRDRSGLLVDISKIFTEEQISISRMNVRTSKSGTATIEIGFEIKSKEELGRICSKISRVESVLSVERSVG